MIMFSGVTKFLEKSAWQFTDFALEVENVIETLDATPSSTGVPQEDAIAKPDRNMSDEPSHSALINASQVMSSQKLKRRPKRNHKVKNVSQNPVPLKKSVTWGHVEEFCFSRDLGYSSVPSSGGFPLGLSMVLEGKYIVDVDAHEAMRQRNDQLKNKTKPSHHSDGINVDEEENSAALFSHANAISESDRRMVLASILNTLSPEESIAQSVNQNLAQIQRSRKESQGCKCKPIKVDKLSVVKMKHELSARCELVGMTKAGVNDLSKTDLTRKLKEALRSCSLCQENGCECIYSGVGCNSVLCDCLRKVNKTSRVCGNPNGYLLYDADRIAKYRKTMILSAAVASPMSSPEMTVAPTNK